MTRIAADYLWSAGTLAQNVDVEIEDGRVLSIDPARPGADLRARLVMPRMTDLQVNGGGGVMVNDAPTAEGLRAILAAHRRFGSGDILPTVITDAPEVIDAAADAAIACAGETGILGLHIEGPHIAMKRRGMHKPEFIRPLDARTVATVRRLRYAGARVMLTLAPEMADPDLLAQVIATGAVVSAGHSVATDDEAYAAFAAGVSCVTHLYNAMEQMQSRAPGLLGAAINSRAHCGMICDGVHVKWDMLRIALRGRPAPGLCYAVTDAMATVGGPDFFEIYGTRIHVQDGRLVNDEGHLAGAHIGMAQTLANLVEHVGLSLAEAVAMVTDTPRRVMGLAPRRIEAGTPSGEVLALDDAFALLAC